MQLSKFPLKGFEEYSNSLLLLILNRSARFINTLLEPVHKCEIFVSL